MVYTPECKQQLKTMRYYTHIPYIGYLNSGL